MLFVGQAYEYVRPTKPLGRVGFLA